MRDPEHASTYVNTHTPNYKSQVSRREAMYFRRRGVEESDLVLQDPGKYT